MLGVGRRQNLRLMISLALYLCLLKSLLQLFISFLWGEYLYLNRFFLIIDHSKTPSLMPDRIPTLIICTAGICISYLIYGLIQERLYLYRSPDDGASFQYTTFLMFSQAITNTIAAKFGIWMKRKINSRNNNHQNINRRPFNVKLVFISKFEYYF